ncbi:MAG: dTDP-4-dehydrorhamnose reductase [Pseudomonadota bacterium]
MKIALFGRSGQVATEVQRRAPDGVTVDVIDRSMADFARPEMVFDAARALDADAAINAVAYTAVDKAESEPEIANTVNGASVAALLNGCAEVGVPLVHISTDYVFPGDGTAPWMPDATTSPLGAYGESKLLGEQAFTQLAAHPAAVLRTSWVFSAHCMNFAKTMLRLGKEKDSLTIVADQVGGPTPAADIADACLAIAAALSDGHSGGTYHFSGAPDVSWADFAREIFRQADLSCDVIDIPTTDYPTPAKRPLNSRLNCNSLRQQFGIERPDWREGLAHVLKELGT